MGLEGVELIIAVEEKFNIEINDADAVQCTTPRKLVELILSKTNRPDEKTCITQHAFYRLRRAFRDVLSTPRSHFLRETRLGSLIPKEDRKRVWNDIKATVGAERWPGLLRPQWLVNALSGAVLCIAVAAYWIVKSKMPSGAQATGYAAVAAALSTYLAVVLSRPAATVLFCSTVEQLVRFLVATSPDILKMEAKACSAEEVRAVVAEILRESFGITKFDDDDHFVDKLGLE